MFNFHKTCLNNPDLQREVTTSLRVNHSDQTQFKGPRMKQFKEAFYYLCLAHEKKTRRYLTDSKTVTYIKTLKTIIRCLYITQMQN